MDDRMDFDAYTRGLIEGCRATAGVQGLVLVGSTTSARAAGRDEFSDHDFYVLLTESSARPLRKALSFLPFRKNIVAVAHEGSMGASVLYRDGHILEFAAATEAELRNIRIRSFEIAYEDRSIASWLASAVHRGTTPEQVNAADETSLALIKLLIGMGRGRRGERINAGSFVRTYVVGHLVTAILERLPFELSPARDGLDPVRRFEECYPSLSGPLGLALDQPLERAGRALYDMARSVLEPGWPQFPTAAADVVATRLGWN